VTFTATVGGFAAGLTVHDVMLHTMFPVEAIYYEDDLPTQWAQYKEDNARFFTDTLTGRNGPLDSPGGAARLGPLGVDTPLVAGFPPRAET
jgi:hypothetical protein